DRLRRRAARQGGRPVERPLPDDGESHGHAPAAQGAAGGARRPREAGRLRRAARQASLRLHASAGTHRRTARARRGDRERARVRVRKEARKPKAAEQAAVDVIDRVANVVLAQTSAVKGGPLRDLSDRLRRQEKADGVIVGSVDDGRAFLVVNFDQSLVDRGLDAVDVVRALGKHIGGGGGGKPTLAEAGGKNPGGAADALAAAKELVGA